MVDDRRKRFMELIGPVQVIKYYTGVDADGRGTKQRGAIKLDEGFSFKHDGAKLEIDTPSRTWVLMVADEEWGPQMDEWMRQLEECVASRFFFCC
jgi:hypothetical protein